MTNMLALSQQCMRSFSDYIRNNVLAVTPNLIIIIIIIIAYSAQINIRIWLNAPYI